MWRTLAVSRWHSQHVFGGRHVCYEMRGRFAKPAGLNMKQVQGSSSQPAQYPLDVVPVEIWLVLSYFYRF
jgi:hypothetical protein